MSLLSGTVKRGLAKHSSFADKKAPRRRQSGRRDLRQEALDATTDDDDDNEKPADTSIPPLDPMRPVTRKVSHAACDM